MPAFQNRAQQSRSEEQQEFPIRGPFGGVLSEIPVDAIERYAGFLDLLNVICRLGSIGPRPGFTSLTAMPNPQEPIMGVADFFDRNGTRHQLVITPTRLLSWNGGGAGSWTVIAGVLSGSSTQVFNWAVMNYKLCFSQGVDKVKTFDGIAVNFIDAAAAAVPAFHMMELNNYLIVGNTIEGGQSFPQRIRWTSPGDTTDWTSLSAGAADLINDLGPINALVKLYQYGYAIHQFGVTQIIPTGNGLNPFNIQPLASANHGAVYPNSVAKSGGEFACWAGLDNIYQFDGTSIIPIGDRKIEGGSVGARSRILGDLANASSTNSIFGYITTMLGTTYYNAYWLAIPGIAVWCYNFDEGNWTRFTYAKAVSTMGRFSKAGIIRIIDLVGPILAQTWSPATLGGVNPPDGFLLGFGDGTPGYVDFTNRSELAWSITSGQHIFADARHGHNVKKFRITIKDSGQTQFTISVTGILYPNPNAQVDNQVPPQPISTNAAQVTKTQTITMGNGSGQVISRVVDFSVPGQYISWQVNGQPNTAIDFVEFTPIFDIGGEQRGA
jgi:hypothetical protein